MKLSFFVSTLVFCGLVFVSCQRSGSYSFDDITYVTSFDSELRIPAQSSTKVELGVDGIQGIKVYGPYLIVSSESEDGLITIFEKCPPYNKLGSFFKKGNGPGELIYPFLPSSFNYHTSEDGSIYAEIDNRAGKLIRFNISKSIQEGRTISEVIGKTENSTFEVIDLGEDGTFYKSLSPERDAQIRYIMRDGQTIVTKSMEVLNSARIKNKADDGTRFNVLSGGVKYDSASKCFFETPGEINAFHVYSLNDSIAKTFCIGDKLYDYNEIADRPIADRPITSLTTRLYDYFLALLYLDISALEYSLEPWLPSLILYYWHTGDIVKIHLPDKVNSFDMDEETLSIYAFDSHSETLYVYDVSHI